MRTNPGRKARRINRFGHRQSTRMTEYQRNRQPEVDRFDAMLCHLGVRIDAEIVEDDDDLDDTATEADEPLAYPGGHLAAGGREATAYERAILGALSVKPVYQGSVHADVVAARRKHNRAARRARRANRAAVVWLMAFSMLFGGALYYSTPAHALNVARQVTVSIGWDPGGCVGLTEPDGDAGRSALTDSVACDADQGVTITYLSKPGQWYGVKMTAPGYGLACKVSIGNRVVTYHNEMDTVDCLARW